MQRKQASSVVAENSPSVICLIGGTAAGKSALAISLAASLPVHLISVDSAMVFCGMDLGTGKPDKSTLQQHPHALVDILDAAETWSAGAFVRRAREEIALAHSRGLMPLLVGGTMLYFHALLNGIAQAPAVSEPMRLELRHRAQSEGWPLLHRELAELDAHAARRIDPQDALRLERALGVVLETGRTLTDWHSQQPPGLSASMRIELFSLERARADLHLRLEKRLHGMLAAGLIEEVEGFRQRGDLTVNMTSMRAIGYRQIWQWLDGRGTREEMIERILVASRILLRRQMNWMRRFDGCIPVRDSVEIVRQIQGRE